jgi:hypothetical protein
MEWGGSVSKANMYCNILIEVDGEEYMKEVFGWWLGGGVWMMVRGRYLDDG